MALRTFFDGSGKARDPGCRFVSLASFAGADKEWEDIRATWLDVLSQHDAPFSPSGKRYFHSKEAMHHDQGYSCWNTKRVAALTNDLFQVSGGFSASGVCAPVR